MQAVTYYTAYISNVVSRNIASTSTWSQPEGLSDLFSEKGREKATNGFSKPAIFLDRRQLSDFIFCKM